MFKKAHAVLLFFAILLTANFQAALAATVAGATPGSFNVNPGGAATYDIPIWMPAGPNGVQPMLSIHYDSSRGFGTLGAGWSLNGLGAIYRCNKTFAQDAAPASVGLLVADGYCLDGKRLRLTGGTYGAASSTYETEIADFGKITAYGTNGNGPAYFYAQRKDGLIYEYGNSTSAVIKASGTSTPYQWRLSKVRDRNGNQYVVTYGTGASGSAGIGVPVSISYTPTSAGASAFKYSIVFTYTANTSDGTEVAYIAGGSTINNNLLSRIEIRRAVPVKSLRVYNFGYETSPTTNQRRLISVQECSDTASTSCLSPTVIDYQDGAKGVAATASTAVTGATAATGAYDFNGDGRKDLLYRSGSDVYVAFAAATGFGTPILTGISSTTYTAADLVGRGQDDILALSGGVFYRYYWTGSTFASVSSGVSIGSDEYSTAWLADINGDGLPDLITRSPPGTLTLYTRLNTTTGGAISFAARNTVIAASCDFPNCRPTVTINTDRGPKDNIDFDGDGRDDIVVRYNYIDTSIKETYVLRSVTGGFHADGPVSTKEVGTFVKWNDDDCTDIVFRGEIKISGCNGAASQTLPFSETFIGVMDWNGDGRTDLLVNSGGNIGVRLSTGGGMGALITTTIPVPATVLVFDQNGDGLDDLGDAGSVSSPSTVTYRLHAGAGTPPDLVTSLTDGYGIEYQPSYISIAQGSYTKGTGAVYPEVDMQKSLYVARQVQASDGAGGTYTKTYTYAGARVNLQGRGFSGFQSVAVSDSRGTAPQLKTFYKTDFPYTGLPYQQDVYQHDGTTPISSVTNTLALKTLSSTAYQQRYFPYISNSSASNYEVGGTKNGQLLAQRSTSRTYDNYGNVTSSTSTLTDKDSTAPQSPTYNQSWTTTVTNTISPNTANWCLGIPTQTVVTKSAAGVTAISRTASFTPDYVNCRISQQIVEPSSTQYKVTVGYGYDSFGNINSQAVTGVGMTVRNTSANWGTTGQFPISFTNAMTQASSAGYDDDTGFQTSATDANGLTTSWTYDSFGRVLTELKPDGTSTTYSYNLCASVAGGCQNGDPGSAATTINKMVVIATAKDTGGASLRDDWLYLDQLGRTIVTKSKTLTGSYSRIGTQYDAYGRLYRQTQPCDAASCTVYWTTNGYDAANRLTSQSRRVSVADSGTQTTSLSYLGMTTVVTDAQGKTTTKAMDPNGWLRQSKDHDGYSQSFAYDAFGSLKGVADSQSNNLFSASYDYGIAAFRRQSVDMDLGTWNYTPDALGEITAYTDAKGSSFSLTYDKLSRPLTRSVSGEGTTTWTWGSSASAHNIGQLQSVTSTGGTTESYSYDSKARLSQLQVVSDATYNYDAAYNTTTGFLDTLTYPTSTSSYRLKLKYGYQNGLLKQVSDYNAGSTVFWQATAMNPRFQITQETLGNGIVRASGYDAVNGELLTLQAGVGGGSGVQNAAYQYDKLGNVTQRQNLSASLTETFTYDNLYRLDASKLNGTTNLDLSYDALGNITKRCEPSCGSTWTYDTTRKHAVRQASVGSTTYSYTYDANGNAISRNGNTITWNKYNEPTQIDGTGESVELSYDASFQRWKQVYTQGSTTETTIYVGGLLEKVTSGSTTDWRHSIYANGERVAIVSRSSTGTNTTRYVLEDHQNSIASFTDGSGGTIVGESFTAFGARRNPNTWSGAPSSSDLTTIDGISRDGYTGQTALGNLGLNHMNGRVQDTFSGRFLSADPYVSEPGNTQGFNRYSYVNNNPLSFIDPSGFAPCVTTDAGEGGKLATVCVVAQPPPPPNSSGVALPVFSGRSGNRATVSNIVNEAEGSEADPLAEIFVTGTRSGGFYGYFDASLLGEFGQYTFLSGTGFNAFITVGTKANKYGRPGGGLGFANGGRTPGVLYDAGGNIVGEEPLVTGEILPFFIGGIEVVGVKAVEGVAAKWTFGAGKSATKWANQMAKRGWNEKQITEALSTKGIPARNAVNSANSATRHIHPTTGQSIVIDNKTNEIIHVGGKDFDYSHWDLP